MSLRRCPRCPQRALPGANFCPRCGKSLALAPPPGFRSTTVSTVSTHPDLEPLPAGGFLAVVASVIAGGLGVVLLVASQRGGDALMLVVGLFLVGVSLAALATAVSCMGSDGARGGGGTASAGPRPLPQRVRSGEQPFHPARLGDA